MEQISFNLTRREALMLLDLITGCFPFEVDTKAEGTTFHLQTDLIVQADFFPDRLSVTSFISFMSNKLINSIYDGPEV